MSEDTPIGPCPPLQEADEAEAVDNTLQKETDADFSAGDESEFTA